MAFVHADAVAVATASVAGYLVHGPLEGWLEVGAALALLFHVGLPRAESGEPGLRRLVEVVVCLADRDILDGADAGDFSVSLRFLESLISHFLVQLVDFADEIPDFVRVVADRDFRAENRF